ncbi:MAG TPA: LemA family protein [Negativicutes bacterium]|nr:LemA family protein [Negativicutes bacterium]
MIGFAVIGVVVLGLVGWLVSIYNTLVKLRNMVQNSWAQIDVQLKRRFDLVPNLVETVKGYATHEKEVFEKVTEARSMVQTAQSVEQRQQAENTLTTTLRSLFAVAEAYPQLQANQNFMELQRELSDLESKIAFARQFYNDTTMKFNTETQTFPTNILASMFGFQAMPYFQVEEGQRQAVQVKF